MPQSDPPSYTLSWSFCDNAIRSADAGAAPFVEGVSPACQKIFLARAKGWETCFALVKALDPDMCHVITNRNHIEPDVNVSSALFLLL